MNRLIPFGLGLAMALLVSEPSEAVVAHLGNDLTTNASWRSAAALQADGVYGTDGYFLGRGATAGNDGFLNPYLASTNNILSAAQGVNQLPAYITGLEYVTDGAGERGSSWGGGFDTYGALEPAPGFNTGRAGASVLLDVTGSSRTGPMTVSLARTPGATFRMTIIGGFQSAESGGDGHKLITVDDGSGPISTTIDIPAGQTNEAYYSSFLVGAGNSPITLTFDAVSGDTDNSQFSGIALDDFAGPPPPPPPAPPTLIGIDAETNGRWRTPSVAKPLEADGDNIYGSQGYVLYQWLNSGYSNPYSAAATVRSLPGYIASVSDPPRGWGGGAGVANFSTADDPAGGVHNATHGHDGNPGNTITIGRATEDAFRLTLMASNEIPRGETFSQFFEVRNGSSLPTLVEHVGDNDVQYFVFDIAAGLNPITVKFGPSTSDNPGLMGLAFDRPIPEPSSVVLAGFGVMALLGIAWRRRRR